MHGQISKTDAANPDFGQDDLPGRLGSKKPDHVFAREHRFNSKFPRKLAVDFRASGARVYLKADQLSADRGGHQVPRG